MIKKLFFVSALIISAALAFVACSSDDDNNDYQGSLAKTTWTPEVSNPDQPVTISIVSEQEGYLCSSFKTSDGDGKEYKFNTRIRFSYQKEGGKYNVVIKAIAAEFDGNWESTDFDGSEYPMCFTVNENAKTMTLTYGDGEKVNFKQADYAPISWPETAPDIHQAKTKDDVLGYWIGGMAFPFPVMITKCSVDFVKRHDIYYAFGCVSSKEEDRHKVFYDIDFRNCSYTVDNGTVVVEEIDENTRMEIKTVGCFFGIAGVFKGGKPLMGLPAFVMRRP